MSEIDDFLGWIECSREHRQHYFPMLNTDELEEAIKEFKKFARNPLDDARRKAILDENQVKFGESERKSASDERTR